VKSFVRQVYGVRCEQGPEHVWTWKLFLGWRDASVTWEFDKAQGSLCRNGKCVWPLLGDNALLAYAVGLSVGYEYGLDCRQREQAEGKTSG
jgi:hypothetical protein